MRKSFLLKLIIAICMISILLSFGGTTKVYATEEDTWGGVLIKPVVKLFTAIGDGVMDILHKCIENQDVAFVQIDTGSNWKKWGIAIGIILAVVAIVAAVYFAPVAILAAIGANTIITLSAALIIGGGAAGYFVVDRFDGADLPKIFNLPVFKISLDKIFSNEMALTDVNFFNPMEDYVMSVEISQKTISVGVPGKTEDSTEYDVYAGLIEVFFGSSYNSEEGAHQGLDLKELYDTTNFKYDLKNGTYKSLTAGQHEKIKKIINNMGLSETSINATKFDLVRNRFEYESGAKFDIAGKMILNPSENKNTTLEITFSMDDIDGIKIFYTANANTGEEVIVQSTAKHLKDVVSSWYFILRNLALLVLMLVLIYTGIKIVIGSTAGEKAKYKERLMDWLIAVCLVFIMQYIMVLAISLVEEITDLVKTVSGTHGRMAVIDLTPEQKSAIDSYYDKFELEGKSYIEGNTLFWDTDLMGEIKILSQRENEGTVKWVGLSIVYVVLVAYTVFFIWTYLKRVLYMAFLTMIAPLVAMTYPIDKINDGKAQAFDMWLKEYIFNLLIQPMHLLLYTILITAAYELAARSAVYSLVAIGFLIPAEKLIRRFFGFNKAKTPGLLGGAAGAALAMTGIQSLTKHRQGAKHSSGGNAKSDNHKDNSKNIKLSNSDGVDINDAMLGGNPNVNNIIGTNNTRNNNIEETSNDAVGGSIRQNVSTSSNTNTSANTNNQYVETANIPGSPTSGQPSQSLGTQRHKNEGTRKKARFSDIAKASGRTIVGVSGAYARGLKNKALKRIKNGRPIRAMARGTIGLIGGGALGLTGLALGIASGDPSKAFQYTTAGAVGGYGLGKGVAGSVVDTLSVDSKEMQDEIERAVYGDEYKQHQYEELIKTDLESERNINYIRDIYGYTRREAIDFLRDQGRMCYDSGITDVEEMLAINEAVEAKKIPTMEEAIAASKLKQRLPNKVGSMSDKKIKEYTDTYRNMYREKLRKMNERFRENDPNRLTDEKIEEIAEERANATIRFMKSLESSKSSLTKV